TNGKGSTSAFIASMLRAAGKKTGLYTSPHLIQFAERFLVDGTQVAPKALVRAAERMNACDRDGTLTFFEQVTVMATLAFAEAGVEAAVMEVGMGGRFDATTALKADVAVVTGVAMDHQEFLGDTLEAIAGEKAGIFRAGKPAVIGISGEPAAVPVLER